MTGRTKEFLLSGELARLSGVSPDTIRYYERKGLIQRPERSQNRYRKYPVESLDRVRIIRSALAVGFTIAELSKIFQIRDRGGNPCHRVQQVAQEKLKAIEVQIKELIRAKQDLQSCVDEWESLLAHTGPGKRALLLEKLARKQNVQITPSSPLIPAGLKKKKEKRHE
ncbi:MerR family transcriptional regulator [bacterium]|nr:MerR family transcriptional regulator [bacterium]MCI0603109.1 MerR family transcriptional regulator [bacterium]